MYNHNKILTETENSKYKSIERGVQKNFTFIGHL